MIYRCPKCDTTMEQGFILDRTHGSILSAEWVSGLPDKSVFTGIKNLKKRLRFQVMTYRCAKCGFLESYTTQPVEPKRWSL